MSRAFLFIGGPLHGQVRAVGDGALRWAAAELINEPMSYRADDAAPAEMAFRTVTYTLRRHPTLGECFIAEGADMPTGMVSDRTETWVRRVPPWPGLPFPDREETMYVQVTMDMVSVDPYILAELRGDPPPEPPDLGPDPPCVRWEPRPVPVPYPEVRRLLLGHGFTREDDDGESHRREREELEQRRRERLARVSVGPANLAAARHVRQWQGWQEVGYMDEDAVSRAFDVDPDLIRRPEWSPTDWMSCGECDVQWQGGRECWSCGEVGARSYPPDVGEVGFG